MVLRCAVCRRKSSSSVSLLKFPQDTAVSGRWAAFCNLEETKSSTRLCSLHFTPDDFKSPVQNGIRVSLKSRAIPSIHVDSEVTSTDQPRTRKYNTPYINTGSTDRLARRNCCVCRSIALSTHNNNLHFYRFPHNSTRKEEWLHSLEISANDVKPWHRVCSRHFIDGNPNGVPLRSVVHDLAPISRDETQHSSTPDVVHDDPPSSLEGNEMFGIDSQPDATPPIPISNSGSTAVTPTFKRKFRHFSDSATPDLQTPRRKRRCLRVGKLQLSRKSLPMILIITVS